MKEENKDKFNYTIDLAKFPKIAGGYKFGKNPIPSTYINLHYKPNWFHRFFMKLFFGLYWFDSFDK